MKAVTRKAVFATMSLSPIFEVVAEFAEQRAARWRSGLLKQMKDINASPIAGRERRGFRKVS